MIGISIIATNNGMIEIKSKWHRAAYDR